MTQAAAAAARRRPGPRRRAPRGLRGQGRVLPDPLASRPPVALRHGLAAPPGRGPRGETDVAYAERLGDAGIVVSPGSFYGPGQERFFRMALVPTLDECRAVGDVWPD
ncbi:MAG: hypothetical protein R3F30_02435 [Planctomycetota bacterium]